MSNERKKAAAKVIRELYLYPYRSVSESVIRVTVLGGSWLVGIVVQQPIDQRALGGAYLIYALSLLLEFAPETKKHPLARIIHGLFCTLIVLFLFSSLILSFGDPNIDLEKADWAYRLLLGAPPFLGWIIFVYMLTNLFMTLIQCHKIVYDEDSYLEIEKQAKHEVERKQFVENLYGIKGGRS